MNGHEPLQTGLSVGGTTGRNDIAQVAAALTRLNDAWQERRYDDLATAMDPAIVISVGGFTHHAAGCDAVVASYREFMERVTITECRLEPANITVWGDTAVATFRWTMDWLAGGVPNHAAGGDAFVFRRARPGEWLAVWRTMSFDPEQPAS